MSRKKGRKTRGTPGRLWWFSGVFVLVLALLFTKLTLNLGYLLLNHDGLREPWVQPLSVWAENKKVDPKAKKSSAHKTSVASIDRNELDMIARDPESIVDVMAELEKREAAVKKKEEELRRKEKYLNQVQKETEQKLNKLIAIQEEIKAYRQEKASAQSGKLRALVKIYESMKPKGAAKLLENLDEDLVVKIVSNMKTATAASILANMSPEKAVKISKALTTP